MNQLVRAVRRWRATNENASGFASKIPTITEPSGDGILDLAKMSIVPKLLKIWPILLGADDDVSSMRLIGWHQCLLAGSTTLWFPTIIGEFVCTASTAVGIAAAAVLDTERFCDTITPVAARIEDYVIGAGTALMSDVAILSPANNTPGHIILAPRAFEKLELTSDQTTGTATFNALYAFLEE